MTANANAYTADSITILEGLQAVRKRPAMYIGSTDYRGLHHLVYEVVDNSIDEAMAGYCTRIEVVLHMDNSVTVRDNGRGIPVDIHPKEKVPAVQVVMTKLHAGGKFDNSAYKVSGGLHGVGVSCVNALSERLEVTVRRDGKRWKQVYSRGVPQEELQYIGESDSHGTTVRFKPDETIFETTEFSYDTLKKRFEELAYLNKGLQIECRDERTSEVHLFHAEGGIHQFVKDLNSGEVGIHAIVDGEGVADGVSVEFAIQYNAGYKENMYTFANNIRTKEGGTHLAGFKTALTRAINNYIKSQPDLTKKMKGQALSGDDVREGLTAVLSVKLPQPQFEGQTKTKLGNSDMRALVDAMVSEKLMTFFEENPQVARSIIEKAQTAAGKPAGEGDDPEVDTEDKKDQGKKKQSKGDNEDMKIDKSKMTQAELLILEDIEKRYGVADDPAQTEQTPEGKPAVTKSVEKPEQNQETPADGEDIYKGLNPAVKAEIEALRKFREDAENRELEAVAGKYEIIGKKKEELVPMLKSLRATGGTAYNDMIAVLDATVEAVNKSGVFSEVGKSGHGSVHVSDAEGKIEGIAKSYMQKEPSMSYTDALAKAWEDNPDLMDAYDAEEGF